MSTFRCSLLVCLTSSCFMSTCSTTRADVIHILDFDTEFSATFPSTGGTNVSSYTASSFTADKLNSSGTNGVRLVSSGLNVDTTGYKNITLNFSLTTASDLELDRSDSGGSSISGDGLLITGDVDFALNLITSPIAVSFSSDFDDGNLNITNLNFLAAVNANVEVITVSNVTIQGTAVPEPSVAPLWVALSLAFLKRRRRCRLHVA